MIVQKSLCGKLHCRKNIWRVWRDTHTMTYLGSCTVMCAEAHRRWMISDKRGRFGGIMTDISLHWRRLLFKIHIFKFIFFNGHNKTNFIIKNARKWHLQLHILPRVTLLTSSDESTLRTTRPKDENRTYANVIYCFN